MKARGTRKPAGPARRRGAALRQEVRARVEAWLAAVARVRPEDYVEARDASDIPAAAHADSCLWSELLFSPAVSPHCEAAHPRRRIHVARADTVDLIRHDYKVAGLRLGVTEGRNFILVEVARESEDILSLPPAERAPAIRRLARRLFRPQTPGAAPARSTSFRLPAKIEEGTVFDSNPGVDPLLLGDGVDRAEGGIRNGTLYFLWYKREPQLVGFLNPRQWFKGG